jgi:precorrin-2/cobalt-factor-2 C20-methyltransferase
LGKIICTGLGPGDPDLISVRSDRLIRAARHVAYFRKAGRLGHARRIVEGLLAADVTEYPMEYPVTTELPFDSVEYRQLLASFYDKWATRLARLARTDDVVVLCEGDPFFYGSFMHLHTRLQAQIGDGIENGVEIEVVPGITGMSGCWTATGVPMTWGEDVLTVLMGTLPEDDLVSHMRVGDALVVMKTGRNLSKVRDALDRAGRLADAWLVKRGTMPGQRIVRLTETTTDHCPYFATVLVHGRGRGREVPE